MQKLTSSQPDDWHLHLRDGATYRDRILPAIPASQQFEPLMTPYLTDNTSLEEIIRAKES